MPAAVAGAVTFTLYPDAVLTVAANGKVGKPEANDTDAGAVGEVTTAGDFAGLEFRGKELQPLFKPEGRLVTVYTGEAMPGSGV